MIFFPAGSDLPCIENKPDKVELPHTLVLAHGAGAPMDSAFMEAIATEVCTLGIRVVRFEFPYMAQRRDGGKKRPPDRADKLLSTFRQVVATSVADTASCVVAGKSMGGRMASMLLAEQGDVAGGAAGAISLGYPFHPPGKPERLRADHWSSISRPWLIVQGTRDPFGKPAEVAHYPLPSTARVHWLEGGNHDLVPLKKSGFTAADYWQQSAQTIFDFMSELA